MGTEEFRLIAGPAAEGTLFTDPADPPLPEGRGELVEQITPGLVDYFDVREKIRATTSTFSIMRAIRRRQAC